MKKYLIILLVVIITCEHIWAQETQNIRSWYVVANGNDENNGRSEDKAFKTLGKALSSANDGVVKKITVLGTITDYVSFVGSNTNEILITGKDENAKICSEIIIKGEASVRFENVVFDAFRDNAAGKYYCGHIVAQGKVSVTLGKGTIFNGNVEYCSHYDAAITIAIESNGVMEADAEISAQFYQSGVLASGTFVMKDNAKISNRNGTGVYLDRSANFVMQNDTMISGCQTGLKTLGNNIVLMKDNALIAENSNRGVYMEMAWGYSQGSSFTMQDKAAIKNNITEDNGGGIYTHNGSVTLKDNAEISGNKAKKGGGIYYTSSFENEKKGKQFDGGNWPNEKGITEYLSTNAKPHFVITGNVEIKNNTAIEGGGIYVENGLIYELMTTAQVPTDNWVTNSRIKIASFKQLGHSLLMEGGTISENKAEYGGGVYAEKSMSINELKLNENAVLGNGVSPSASLSLTGKKFMVPAFLLSSGIITSNKAEFVGGGVYIKENGAFSQTNGTVTDNTAGDGEGEDIYTQ
jgi:hypothetical protein